MPISIPTPENIKSKAKVARQFLKEKCNVDIGHGQCIELISKLFGFKDWNTAKAELTPFERVRALASIRSMKSEDPLQIQGMSAGEIRRALEGFGDSATVDLDYDFSIGVFINSIDDRQDPEDTIHQEFVVSGVEKVDIDYASLKLKKKSESFSSTL